MAKKVLEFTECPPEPYVETQHYFSCQLAMYLLKGLPMAVW